MIFLQIVDDVRTNTLVMDIYHANTCPWWQSHSPRLKKHKSKCTKRIIKFCLFKKYINMYLCETDN